MENLPKEFVRTKEIIPLNNQGLSSLEEFKKCEQDAQYSSWLKSIGCTQDEIQLYYEYQAGTVDTRQIETGLLKSKLEAIFAKINSCNQDESSDEDTPEPSTSNNPINKILPKNENHLKLYPETHPMNHLKQLEQELFGHLKDDILPINKRRKILRHLERRKERLLAQGNAFTVPTREAKPGSLWDLKEVPHKEMNLEKEGQSRVEKKIHGPQKRTMYTVKDSKIVRLEPVQGENQDEYQAVDIVVPVNEAEERLLEGTKMSLDDIKKIDRFKDYTPGIPSKVLYLKNIAPSVSTEQLSLLFNQFIQDNGGPIDVRLMSGRMRGQAFVAFQNEDTSIQALDEVNGTILSGRPLIVQFGRNTNRIQDIQ